MNSSSSSNDLGREGNTLLSPKKQSPIAKRWTFTLNNWTEEEYSSIVLTFRRKAKVWIMGDEIAPTTGTPHIQGYVEFLTKIRPISLDLTKRIHWGDKHGKPAKGTREENYRYCLKEWKMLSQEGGDECLPEEEFDVMTELYTWQQNCLDLYLSKPDKRNIQWFWSKEGCTGKTEMVRYLYHHYKVPFSYGGSCNDIMNLAYNNIKGCKAFIFCLTRSQKNHVSYKALEQLKDGLISNNKYETGCFAMPSRPHVFVFANMPPDEDLEEEFMTIDRFVLHQI